MVTKQQQFKIIEGDFTPTETEEVLYTLINDKIKFHNLKIMEITEKYSGDTTRSERRIKELQASKKHIKEMIISAKDMGQTISISGTIALKMSIPSENTNTVTL